MNLYREALRREVICLPTSLVYCPRDTSNFIAKGNHRKINKEANFTITTKLPKSRGERKNPTTILTKTRPN